MDKETNDILSIIDKTNPYASFLNESAMSNVDGWLDTGSMVLNGIISGSLFGGIPKNRMTLLAGPSMCLTGDQKIKVFCETDQTNLVQDYEKYSTEIAIKDIDKNKKYFINSPDGWVEIVTWVEKPVTSCWHIYAKNGSNIKCAGNHLLQININNNDSWIYAADLKIGWDKIDTESGSSTVVKRVALPDQKVYDFRVNHPNHRYWAGGFCNHNTGKSYILQKILANAQKEGLTPIIFDSENAIDRDGAIALGLDVNNVKYVPVFSIEECRNTIYDFLTKVKEKGQEGKFIIAIDSLGNMESQLQIGRMEKNNVSADMGSRAKAMKSLLRTCTQLSGLTKTTILATNHIYDDPSAMFPSLVKAMPGGTATVYLPSVTIQLARKPVKEDNNTDGKKAVLQKNYSGIILRALTVKNRFVKQYLEGEMYLSFERGLNKYYGLLELAVGVGAVIQTGSTYQLPDGTKLGYYSVWKDNKELWNNTIIPVVEKKIKQEWKYGNKLGDDDVPEEIPDEVIESQQSEKVLINEDAK